jgi:adenosylcobinamide-GDP ribazoletransferase
MRSLFIAFSTLTILPIPVNKWTRSELKNSVAFYPLVGGILGILLALNTLWSIPTSLKSLFTLIFWIVFTLAFHLDGLADCLDGWLGGKTIKERYRIMKDPSIGVYGTVGITSIILTKYVLLNQLLFQAEAWRWLFVIPMAARWAVTCSCFFNPASPKNSGLASFFLGQSLLSFAISTFFLSLGSIFFFGWVMTWILITSVAISFIINWLSHIRIGKLNGDGLGATIELTETCLLFLAYLKSL